jgi:hypothetical protein
MVFLSLSRQADLASTTRSFLSECRGDSHLVFFVAAAAEASVGVDVLAGQIARPVAQLIGLL